MIALSISYNSALSISDKNWWVFYLLIPNYIALKLLRGGTEGDGYIGVHWVSELHIAVCGNM